MQDFTLLLQKKVIEIENILRSYLPKEEGYQKTVLEAMNYSMLAGGKRLRPMLMQETYRLFGGQGSLVEPFMAAIEMIHTYSLVHDDLPAMDNDEYRRGKKTTWSVYGEGMGILAGDALLNYAFETALKAGCEKCRDAGENAAAACNGQQLKEGQLWAVLRALNVLAGKAGVYGMIGGQTADIEAENRKEVINSERLLFIHKNKTAALIQSSMMIGAILAGADETRIEAVEKCAYNIGIAFQIQDDILDVTGDSKELGKQVGSDAQNDKQTYVTLHGLEKAVRDVEALSQDAITLLHQAAGEEGEKESLCFLETLIQELIYRRK